MTRVTIAAVLAAAIALSMASHAPAAAHAVLLATVPADGATLDQPPAEIVLSFNEAVTPVALRLIGPGGRQSILPAAARDLTVQAALPDDLPVGGYLVSWRVISADAHPIGGAFAFSVGARAPPPGAAEDDRARREAWWHLAVIANRALGDAALLFAAGGALCAAFVFGGIMSRRLRAVLTAAAAVAVLSGLASMVLARGWIAASPIAALSDAEL
jgi:copper transport protein